MTDIIDRLHNANGSDRDLDLAIYQLLWPESDLSKMTKQARRGLDSQDGYAWTINGASVIYEKWVDGRCPHNGGYPLPAYTGSVDAALTLAEGIRGLSLHTRSNPDMGGRDWLVSAGSNRAGERSWALALCVVGLRDRAPAPSNGDRGGEA